MSKGVDERIVESVRRWFSHIEIIENDRIAKRVHVGVCAGSHLVGRPWKTLNDSVNDCLKNRGLNVEQARKMMYDRNEWRGFARRMIGVLPEK